MRGAAEDEAPPDHEQHKQHRRLVGKVQWLAYARPDISYGAKELARSPQAPTQFDNKKFKHMIRHLKGTRYLRRNRQPKCRHMSSEPRATSTHTQMPTGHHARQTRKSTTGFVTQFFGAAIHIWKQNTSNNGTFISRVRIGTAAQESLYISNFIKEAFGARTNIRTHADSSAAKSITMREGTSQKPNHIQLRHSQQAHVHSWPVSPSQQFHTSKYSSQHSLLNNSCTGHLSLSRTKVKALQLSFT